MIGNGAAGACTFSVRFGLAIAFISGASPVFAQINFDGNATHKEELKYSLQEAKEVESVYKETHLNLDNRSFKKGEAAHKRVKIKKNRKINNFDGPGSAVLRSNRTKKIKIKTRDKP